MGQSSKAITIFWYRRDLRLDDNCGLYHALQENEKVLPVFIFDSDILNKLDSRYDPRIEFIYLQIKYLKQYFEQLGTSLMVMHGRPLELFRSLLNSISVKNLYLNHDYEPAAIERDQQIKQLFEEHDATVYAFKDQVIFEKNDILKKDGKPYTVFTPYRKKWEAKLQSEPSVRYSTDQYADRFYRTGAYNLPALEQLGFCKTNTVFPPAKLDETVITNYHHTRDYPYLNGTTRLGIHFRHGTISIREAVRVAADLNGIWLNELIWRDFYMMILWHFPHVVDHSFKRQYDHIDWRNNENDFNAWCQGNTGYPIVDAGMRQLNQTGYMHNRVRMIVASFLTKHLLVDWRWGECYFAQKLIDYELASNNGGWQWAAGSGCDAAPYFRIFNPYRQTERFDPHYQYIKHWVPEFQHPDYEKPIVDHKFARERALQVYGKELKK
jgi:deoxyribodipyrimidine photo-lyase